MESILKNEKYKGSALLQKTFTTDFLTKKKKLNEGEVPQYYVENSHPAIVSKEVYDLVQIEFEKRRISKNYKTTASCFSGMIYCGECGNMYGSKVWHSNSKYRRTIWQCNGKFKNAEKCRTPHLTEEVLKNAFIDVFCRMTENKEDIIDFAEYTIRTLSDTSITDEKIKAAKDRADEKLKCITEYVDLNKREVIPQSYYNQHFDRLVSEYDKENDLIKCLEHEKAELNDRRKKCISFLQRMQESRIIQEFDDELFIGLTESFIIFQEKVHFEFKNGTVIEYTVKSE